MKIGKYIVKKENSIYVSRNGKSDCTVWAPTDSYGATMHDGARYSVARRYACESGELLRDNLYVEDCINIAILRQIGMIDNI